MQAVDLIDKAGRLVGGDRAQTHGDKHRNFSNIALLWNAYLAAKSRAQIDGADCGLVIPVTINAVDRMIFAGARPHVGEEILKRSPALANLDPAPAVQIKVVLARVSAALDHAAPNLVFRSGRPTTANRNCHSVRDVAFADNVSVEAPAALGIPGSEIVDASDYLSAAIALAKNLARQLSGFLNNIFGVAFNDKTTVSLSNIVSAGAH